MSPLLSSKDFHVKTKKFLLRLWHVNERGLVEVDKKDFLGCEKLNELESCDN